MILNSIKYRTNTASFSDISLHLHKCDKQFEPPLSTSVDIDEYAKKITNNALKIEAWDKDNLVGLVAYYCNDKDTRKAYITNVSVLNNYLKKGIANKLLDLCIEYVKKQAFVRIDLEVEWSNKAAIALYKKNGFFLNRKKNSKNLMTMYVVEKKPLVSICCITYNHENYITETIEGFLMQHTNFAFEILIHNDASTDKTAEIIHKYEARYPDIVKPIYQVENQYSNGVGISATYNWPRAKGKYIAMCEGDDYWTDPLKLEKQVSFLEKNSDYVMHCHNALIVYENNIVNKHLFNENYIKDTLTFSDIIKEWNIPTASIVYRRLVLSELPNWFTSIYHGDYALGLLLSGKGKVKYSDEVMSVYRKQFGALSFNPKINSEFASTKLIELFEHVNTETGYKYLNEIQPRINNLQKINQKLKTKRKYPFLFPKYFLKKILLNFGFSVYKNHNKNIFDFKIININKLRIK